MNTHPSMASLQQEEQTGNELSSREMAVDDLDLENGMYDLVIGNDIEELKRELQKNPDDSDAESSESGFSEQGEINKDGGTPAAGRNGSQTISHVTENGHSSDKNMSNNNSVILESREGKNKSRGPAIAELNTEDAVTAL